MSLLKRAANRLKYSVTQAEILARALHPSKRTAHFKGLYSTNGEASNLDGSDAQCTPWKYQWILNRLQREWHTALGVYKKLVDGLMPEPQLIVVELKGASICAMHHAILCKNFIPLVHEERVVRPDNRVVVQKTCRKAKG